MIAALSLLPDDAAGRARLAECLARPGFTRGDCEQDILASMVAGRFCDGATTLQTTEAPPPARCEKRANGFKCCFPKEVVDAKKAARAADPLPSKSATTHAAPSRPSTTALVVGGAIVVGGLYLLLR